MITQWWCNWARTYGYLAAEVAHPRNLAELVGAVKADPNTLVRAVGGGWSASDATLPFKTTGEAMLVSIGAHAVPTMPNVGLDPGAGSLLQNFDGGLRPPLDRAPLVFDRVADKARTWQEASGAWEYDAAADGAAQALVEAEAACPKFDQLATKRDVRLIDCSELRSSLQANLRGLLCDAALNAQAASAGSARPFFYFHVEGGITISELNTLLDLQSPRMAIRSSSGSPGATLAGAIATSTHGAELQDDLLVDTVMAIHLVGADGKQWWLEGDESIADPAALAVHYPDLNGRIITKSMPPTGVTAAGVAVTAEQALRSVAVSLGAMGVVYSVVLKVFPQFGVRQVVKARQSWDPILQAAQTKYAPSGNAAPPTVRAGLDTYDRAANLAVYQTLLDGTLCGTEIPASRNLYCDLAFNPRTHECWVTHREELPVVPLTSSVRDGGILTQLRPILDTLGRTTHQPGLNALLAYLGYSTQTIFDVGNDIQQAQRLINWVTHWPQPVGALLAAVAAQARANGGSHQRPAIAGDALTAILNGVQGMDKEDKSEACGVSYRVGDVGWPDGGIAGVAMEIALPPEAAFSFLKRELLDDLLRADAPRLLLGYISVRICRQTKSMVGMQQFGPHSIMIELVGYRSPEAAQLFDAIQQRVIDKNLQPGGPGALLHWGLQNEKFTHDHLVTTPIAKGTGAGPTRAQIFKAVRELVAQDRFLNTLIRRVGL